MTQKWCAALLVCVVIGAAFATRTLNGQAQATQAHAAEFQQDVLPVLAKSCLGCHNEKAQAGKLNLEPLRDPATTPHTLPSGRAWSKKCRPGRCRRQQRNR